VRLLVELFDGSLKSVFDLRRAFRQGSEGGKTTLEFEDLWLLFEPGELVYERQPNDPSPNSPPKLWRVLQFSGSRRLLNNRDSSVTDPLCQNLGSGSKGQENRFLIKGFSLDADREFEKCVAYRNTIQCLPGMETETSGN
jgi:hypothetical protein